MRKTTSFRNSVGEPLKYYPHITLTSAEFRTDPGGRGIYTIYCPICAQDPELFGDGFFETDTRQLQRKAVPCGCSIRPVWSEQQYRVRIRRRCEECNYEWVSTEGRWNRSKTRITVFCREEQELVEMTVLHLMEHVPTHQRRPGSFREGEPADVYVLRIEGEHYSFIGYGISGKSKIRLQEHKTSLKKYGFRIIEARLFPTTGVQARQIENKIKEDFPRYSQEMDGFKTEATFLHLHTELLEFVENAVRAPTGVEYCEKFPPVSVPAGIQSPAQIQLYH